jgi:2-C-methyl-D-erythritol 4-phosphate cytidylyltransferase
VAAGAGQRLGGGQPKAFVDLGGTPLLVHSTRAMAAVCDQIVVVVSDGHVDQGARSLGAAGIEATLCVGGATRTDSVAAGVLACQKLGTCPDDLVGVHDAARPLASVELIARTFAATSDGWDATAPGLPVVDTLKLVGADHTVIRTVDRQGLWAVQTPQVFRWGLLEHVYLCQCPETATDDLGLAERAGYRVRLIPGETTNLKITYPQDLVMAEALLAVLEGRARIASQASAGR